MSKMRKNNSEKHRGEKQEVILRKEYHPELFRVNRYLVWVSLAIMSIVLVSFFVLFPNNALIKSYEAKQTSMAAHKVPMNPVLSAEIDVLKGQVIGLISGSIESKLRVLEASVRSGNVTAADLGTIQDIKNDVQVLKTYSATGAGRLIAEPYANNQAASYEIKNQLLNEVSQLKQLIYLSIASCSLMFAAVGGIWLRNGLRLGSDVSGKKTGVLLDGKADRK